ncbi:MAG: type II toxin-antitoxin system VapB family antitoxin [Comamonadaceae bacterium]|nr:type II toxin-antitoxin system VapB family antitoxin [Burkholderiales bacterium]MEB2348926.1 type II toxin-antitoxin system VapB family antitoxin [Comamonadaceae bacterium]
MRTNIDIDDELMAAVMGSGEFKTKKEAVEEGLRLLRRRKAYQGLRALRGKLHWDDSAKLAPAWEAGDVLATAAVNEPAAAPYAGGARRRPAKARP